MFISEVVPILIYVPFDLLVAKYFLLLSRTNFNLLYSKNLQVRRQNVELSLIEKNELEERIEKMAKALQAKGAKNPINVYFINTNESDCDWSTTQIDLLKCF